jgi:hypothetical protein
MHRMAHVSSHVFDAAKKRGYGIQSDAGTVAAFDSAINLGCVHPGNHACETCSPGSGLVLGVFTRKEWSVTIVVCRWCSVREWTRLENDGQKGHKKGHENVPFWVLDGFVEISATLLERMAGTTRLELATSAVTVSHWKYVVDNVIVYRLVYRGSHQGWQALYAGP